MGRKMIFKCSKCRKIIKGTGKTGMCQSCIMTGEGNSMFGKKRPDNVIRFSGTKNHMFKTGKRCKNYHNYCFCGNEIRYNSKHCIYCDAQINRNGRDIGSKYIQGSNATIVNQYTHKYNGGNCQYNATNT